jgi:hypothetical protein
LASSVIDHTLAEKLYSIFCDDIPGSRALPLISQAVGIRRESGVCNSEESRIFTALDFHFELILHDEDDGA